MTHTPPAPRPDRLVEPLLENHDTPTFAARLVEHIAAIAFGNIADYITIARDGTFGIAPDRPYGIALEAFDVDYRPVPSKNGGGRILRLRIRLLCKLTMLDALADHLGLPAARGADAAEGVIEEYAYIAYANMSDYLAVAEDGTARLHLSRARRAQLAALRELVVVQHIERDGGLPPVLRSWRLKLASKQRALAALVRYAGVFGKPMPTTLEEPGAMKH